MASAKITLENGTQITIEGDSKEVASIIDYVSAKSGTSSALARSTEGTNKTKSKKIKTSPTDLILSLADGGFFKTPKDLAAIKEGLAEIGHIYPVQTLSSIVFKMVRKKYLRRIKQDGRWVYVR